MRTYLIGVAILAAMTASPAIAKFDTTFVPCDGFNTPTPKTDMMMRQRDSLASSISNTAPGAQFQMGAEGLATCDAALADPRLLPDFWERRAHILQARAFHLLALRQPTDALASLDQSDTVMGTRGDRLLADSEALTNQVLRGVALYQLNRNTEARKVLDAVIASRPYAPSVVTVVRSVEVTYDYDYAVFNGWLATDALVAPSQIKSAFWTAVFLRDFTTAVKLGGQIGFDLPRSHGRWQIGASEFESKMITDRAEIAGATAYAYLATGRRGEAEREMADARKDIVDATVEPQPEPGRTEVSHATRDAWNARVAAGQEATRALDRWEKTMKLRDAVAGKSVAESEPIVTAALSASSPVIADIAAQMKPANDLERAKIKELMTKTSEGIDQIRRKAFLIDLPGLLKKLPRPQSMAMRPKMWREGIGILRTDATGFAIDDNADTGLVTIRMGSMDAPLDMVEEAVLLRAALYARGKKQTDLIVDSTRTIYRQTTVSSWYSRGSTYDSGFEQRMNFRMVTRANLPATVEPMRWRLIPVDAVIAALGPKYIDAGAAN